MRGMAMVPALLAALAMAACGGSAAPAPAAATGCAGTSHRASLAVVHLGGASRTACVGFRGDTIAGVELLKQSRVEYQTENRSWGLAICQVDNEPAQFGDCIPRGAPYWSIWIAHRGQPWEAAQVGISKIELHDGEALGLRYVSQAGAPSPPPIRPAS